ncbi:MAG: CoA transferase [Desulfobulbaceae bacterium]|nr:CoA transferase [Desulfobulbaceae bacterium]
MTTAKTLAHITVIDLTQNVAGAYCSKLMAGFGAEVIKVEPPRTGDAMRTVGPFCDGREGLERSIPFLWLNTGKKSITLDINSSKGLDLLAELMKKADVVMESLPLGKLQELGLEYEVVHELNPGLVMTSITNFGRSGPYRDFEAEEMQIQAMSGMMHMTGEASMKPLAAGPAVCHYLAGMHAYTATLMALFQKSGQGKGQHVDVSVQECGMENVEIALTQCLQEDKNPKRGPHLGVPWSTYTCADGYGVVISMPARKWHKAAEIFDDPFLFQEKYRHIIGRIADRKSYEEVLEKEVKKFKKKELFLAGQKKGLAFGMVSTLAEALELEQHSERGFFEEIDHPDAGRRTYCSAPFKMSETPWTSARAPLLGEHNSMIYGERLGCTPAELNAMKSRGII